MATACRRTFRCFIWTVAWIPVIFVSLLIVWAYYVYVYVMNISGKRQYTKPYLLVLTVAPTLPRVKMSPRASSWRL